MGYLTTLTIYNDGVHLIDPRDLTPEQKDEILSKLYHAIIEANVNYTRNESSTIGFRGFANLIEVQHSRHADDHTVYVHFGNSILNINPYNGDFKKLKNSAPNVLQKYIKVAQEIVTMAKKELNKKE